MVTSKNKINSDKKLKFLKLLIYWDQLTTIVTNKENTMVEYTSLLILKCSYIQNHYELTRDDALKFMLNEKIYS